MQTEPEENLVFMFFCLNVKDGKASLEHDQLKAAVKWYSGLECVDRINVVHY
jgi:hypothetical protein